MTALDAELEAVYAETDDMSTMTPEQLQQHYARFDALMVRLDAREERHRERMDRLDEQIAANDSGSNGGSSNWQQIRNTALGVWWGNWLGGK